MNSRFYPDGESFVIENYNSVSPFSSFFPGLAGEAGKPIWLFYVNRGQSISSFGVNNKDGAMVEFLPANKAYQSTPLLGFRTFLRSAKIKDWFEPFSLENPGLHQRMIVRPYELEIIDEDPSIPVSTSVVTFGVPQEHVPLLARRVTITNRSNSSVQLQVVDGLPRVVPFGMNDYLVKNMARTIEAFAEVGNLKSNVPFFKLKIEPSDRPELTWLNAGFFSFGLNNQNYLPVIVDPSTVFGADTSFFRPADHFSVNGHSPTHQLSSSIMPSSFFGQQISIPPRQSKSWVTYFGQTPTGEEAINFAERVRSGGEYFERKRNEMKRIFDELVGHFGLKTGIPVLNNYANVTFMDNVLRGGYPLSLNPGGPVLHVYSRKHGDMERDYNSFQISANYYSQGNGNFRDVDQNRRNDLYLNPEVGTSNLEFFFNLIQLDGFNPLIINPARFVFPKDMWGHPDLKTSDDMKRDLLTLKRGPVLAGQIFEFVVRHAADPLNVNILFRTLIKECSMEYRVEHGEGYWIDHWTYNLDHLEQYLAVFPDRKVWVLYEKDDFTFYDSDHVVRPRREKYLVTSDGHLRQYGAVTVNQQKKELLASRSSEPNLVRTDNGRGEIFQTNLFVKLVSLATIKMSSLDPFGVGLEMEADKPGWCDALNGLPGLFGSSTHEMFELSRLVRFILDEALPVAPQKTVEFPTEIAHFIKEIEAILEAPVPKDFRATWDKLASAREDFREKTLFGLSGKTRPVRLMELKKMFERFDDYLASSKKKAVDPATKLPSSYFSYAVDPSALGSSWRQNLVKLPWTQHRLVPFLEGAVHAFKNCLPTEARRLYQAVRRSELFDRKLELYKLNFSLASESTEIGRIRVFAPGWLENEAIFLHMHYKYLLELLRAGLVEEFEKEIEHGLICFRDPKVYGRSIFENSSFIASSSFPDRSVHGKGFVARLSGATSELMSMIYFAFFGARPFKLVEQAVVFSPDPTILSGWFARDHGDSFVASIKLFGVPVSFVCEKISKGGSKKLKPTSYEWISEGRFHNHEGRWLPAETSLALREGKVESLTVKLSK